MADPSPYRTAWLDEYLLFLEGGSRFTIRLVPRAITRLSTHLTILGSMNS
jgi:hypothetical protein